MNDFYSWKTSTSEKKEDIFKEHLSTFMISPKCQKSSSQSSSHAKRTQLHTNSAIQGSIMPSGTNLRFSVLFFGLNLQLCGHWTTYSANSAMRLFDFLVFLSNSLWNYKNLQVTDVNVSLRVELRDKYLFPLLHQRAMRTF